jgi:hypothetical protein
MISVAFRPFLPQAALHPACLGSALRVFLLPVTAKYHLRRAPEVTSHG